MTESLEQLRTQLDESKEKQEHLEQAKAALGEQHNALRFEILGLQKDIESLTGTQNQLDGMIRQQDSQVQTLVDKVNALQNAGRQLEKKIEQLQDRLSNNVLVQEGEQTAEDPEKLKERK